MSDMLHHKLYNYNKITNVYIHSKKKNLRRSLANLSDDEDTFKKKNSNSYFQAVFSLQSAGYLRAGWSTSPCWLPK